MPRLDDIQEFERDLMAAALGDMKIEDIDIETTDQRINSYTFFFSTTTMGNQT